MAVLRASVDTARREDWILDQVNRGIDVLIINLELVKTGLDLMDLCCEVGREHVIKVQALEQQSRPRLRPG